MARKVKIIPQFKDRQFLGSSELTARRWESPLRYCRQMAVDMARRVNESRKLFKWKFYRGDCHSHSQHSDGIGSIAEIAAMAEAAGLDFQFVTDHYGVTHQRECRKHGLWVGQEPGTQHQHLGVLGLDFAFEPQLNLKADFLEARRLGATVFIPHPAGWWPAVVYEAERIEALWDLPTPFLMEVINGAGNIVTAFDYTDQLALDVWDELLMTGRVVHAMGNTDAHVPHSIGICWNGVLADGGDQASILKALSAGRSFASEAPLLNLSVGRVAMGGRVANRSKAAALQATVVDSRGLLRVRLIADGKVRKTWFPDGQTVFEHKQALPAAWRKYVRIEAISQDGRRGYSNPIYLA